MTARQIKRENLRELHFIVSLTVNTGENALWEVFKEIIFLSDLIERHVTLKQTSCN